MTLGEGLALLVVVSVVVGFVISSVRRAWRGFLLLLDAHDRRKP